MKRSKYSIHELRLAVNAVKSEGFSFYKGSKQFNVPLTTIHSNVNGVNKSNQLGAPRKLSKEDEDELAKHCLSWAEAGFPLTEDQVIALAWKLMRIQDKKANKPTVSWYRGFMRRHPNLSTRKAQLVTQASSRVTLENLRGWNREVTDLAVKYNVMHILENKPELIFNLDETNFLVVPESKRVVAAKGARNVLKISNGKEKENVTSVYCISAAGQLIPPTMIYRNSNRIAEYARKCPSKLNKISRARF